MQLYVYHWLGHKPPCKDAEPDGEGGYTLDVPSLDALVELASSFDIMLHMGQQRLRVFLDDRGRMFRQR